MYAFGLVVLGKSAIALGAIFGGFWIVGHCLKFLRAKIPNSKPPDNSFSTLDFYLGATERAVAIVLYLFAPANLIWFIGGWVTLKFALNWQRIDPKKRLSASVSSHRQSDCDDWQCSVFWNRYSRGLAHQAGKREYF
jgi:hypothetical protein